jgi:hypothetical protein
MKKITFLKVRKSLALSQRNCEGWLEHRLEQNLNYQEFSSDIQHLLQIYGIRMSFACTFGFRFGFG